MIPWPDGPLREEQLRLERLREAFVAPIANMPLSKQGLAILVVGVDKSGVRYQWTPEDHYLEGVRVGPRKLRHSR